MVDSTRDFELSIVDTELITRVLLTVQIALDIVTKALYIVIKNYDLKSKNRVEWFDQRVTNSMITQ